MKVTQPIRQQLSPQRTSPAAGPTTAMKQHRLASPFQDTTVRAPAESAPAADAVERIFRRGAIAVTVGSLAMCVLGIAPAVFSGFMAVGVFTLVGLGFGSVVKGQRG